MRRTLAAVVLVAVVGACSVGGDDRDAVRWLSGRPQRGRSRRRFGGPRRRGFGRSGKRRVGRGAADRGRLARWPDRSRSPLPRAARSVDRTGRISSGRRVPDGCCAFALDDDRSFRMSSRRSSSRQRAQAPRSTSVPASTSTPRQQRRGRRSGVPQRRVGRPDARGRNGRQTSHDRAVEYTHDRRYQHPCRTPATPSSLSAWWSPRARPTASSSWPRSRSTGRPPRRRRRPRKPGTTSECHRALGRHKSVKHRLLRPETSPGRPEAAGRRCDGRQRRSAGASTLSVKPLAPGTVHDLCGASAW